MGSNNISSIIFNCTNGCWIHYNGDSKMAITSIHVSVDEDKLDQARRMDYNLSGVLDIALDSIIHETKDYIWKIKLLDSKDKLYEQKRREQELIAELAHVQSNIKELNNMVEQYEREATEYEYEMQMLSLMRKLSGVMINCDFDIKEITLTAPDIIDRIKKLNPSFNLEKHCTKLKAIVGPSLF